MRSLRRLAYAVPMVTLAAALAFTGTRSVLADRPAAASPALP